MDRPTTLEQLRRDHFDLLVVGGGITGTGIALDASLRGLSVALVEKDDFASGTSSRSSKLIHGGLRYLQRLEFGLVREGLFERRELERMAPHLVAPLRFVVPRYAKFHVALRAGLFVYDALALGSRYPRHRHMSPREVRQVSPMLRPSAGGLTFFDALTDDARLVWTIARTAQEAGARIVNYVELTGLLRSDGRVGGGIVRDRETGEAIEVHARVVVNATGVWADEVKRLESPSDLVGIRPSKGTHIVLKAATLPTDVALLLPTRDGRYVFVIPWEDEAVVVGTTDDDYDGPLDDPRAEDHEVSYLLDVLNAVTEFRVLRRDVVSTFAGLRPLVRSGGTTKDISRRHLVAVGPGKMVTITGGKLTAWRRMASDAVDAALEAGEFPWRPESRTGRERLSGGHRDRDPSIDGRLWHRYGSHASAVLASVQADPELAERLHPELPYLKAEAAYAITHEGARRPADVLSRRLRAALTSSDGGRAALDWVAGLLAESHGWDGTRLQSELSTYD